MPKKPKSSAPKPRRLRVSGWEGIVGGDARPKPGDYTLSFVTVKRTNRERP